MQFSSVGFSLRQRNAAPQPPILSATIVTSFFVVPPPAIPLLRHAAGIFSCRCLHLKFEFFNLKLPSLSAGGAAQFSPGRKAWKKRQREAPPLAQPHPRKAFEFSLRATNFVHHKVTPLPESPVLEPTVRPLHIQPVEFFSVPVVRSFMAYDDKSKHKTKNRPHRAPRSHRASPTLARHSSLC
jgi:hypothetical protein